MGASNAAPSTQRGQVSSVFSLYPSLMDVASSPEDDNDNACRHLQLVKLSHLKLYRKLAFAVYLLWCFSQFGKVENKCYPSVHCG